MLLNYAVNIKTIDLLMTYLISVLLVAKYFNPGGRRKNVISEAPDSFVTLKITSKSFI